MPRSDSVPEQEALRKVESGPTFEVWQLRASSMRLDWSRAGIVELTLSGHGYAEFVAPSLRRWNETLLTCERLTLLVDFWDMPGNESQLRLGMTDWVLEHRTRLEPIHLLTRSPLVRMGVTVANIALGGLIQIHGMRATYDSALKAPGVRDGRASIRRSPRR
jgi:hypothetical protein